MASLGLASSVVVVELVTFTSTNRSSSVLLAEPAEMMLKGSLHMYCNTLSMIGMILLVFPIQ